MFRPTHLPYLNPLDRSILPVYREHLFFRSAESYRAYTEMMPWLSVPFQQTAVRAELAELYGIRGIPTLLLLDNNGHIITRDARTELADDPLVEVRSESLLLLQNNNIPALLTHEYLKSWIIRTNRISGGIIVTTIFVTFSSSVSSIM